MNNYYLYECICKECGSKSLRNIYPGTENLQRCISCNNIVKVIDYKSPIDFNYTISIDYTQVG